MANRIKTYPVGTKIKYIGYCRKCNGKTGTVVSVSKMTCEVALPLSTCNVFDYSGMMTCPWEDLESVLVKNQQLLFNFME